MSHDTVELLAMALTALFAILMSLLGGWLLFEPFPAPVRGVGLTLIVLIPLAVSELLKERPPVKFPRRRR